MGPRSPRPVTLDSGGLIAIERGDERIRALLDLAESHAVPVYVPSAVIAEVWRSGSGRQARLAAFLRRGRESGRTAVPSLDYEVALEIGALLARVHPARVSIADAMVAWCVLRFGGIAYTADPDDLGQLLPSERLRVI